MKTSGIVYKENGDEQAYCKIQVGRQHELIIMDTLSTHPHMIIVTLEVIVILYISTRVLVDFVFGEVIFYCCRFIELTTSTSPVTKQPWQINVICSCAWLSIDAVGDT